MTDENDHSQAATVAGHGFDWGHETDDFDAYSVEPDVLKFALGGQAFAVETHHVIELDQPPLLTPVPGLPPHIAGVAVRRRQVLTVLDLGAFFGLTPTLADEPRLVVFETDGLQAGGIVCSVSGLEVWPDDEESAKLTGIDERIVPFVSDARWAPGGRVLLLNVPELLHAAAVP